MPGITQEYQHIEHKKTLGEKHEATEALAGFASAHGGEVHFGITPDGKRHGIQIGKNTLEELANYIKDNTDPPLFPSIIVEGDPDNAVIVVRVDENPIKPVWAFGRPVKRVGRTNQKIGRAEAQRLTDATLGRTWDALPCVGLTLEHLSRGMVESYLRRARQDIAQTSETVLDNLNLRSSGVLFCGAALLFASNPQRWVAGSQMQCARFAGTTSVRFIDEQTLDGDVISQIEGAVAFVARNIRQNIRITGRPEREVVAEYPEEAVREAIINAVCHRDYAALGNVQVRIYDDRLEVWNPGILPQGLSVALLYEEHPSYPRNKRVAEALHRAGLIEKWGTGTLRMVAAYQSLGLPAPVFDQTANSFIVRMLPVPLPTPANALNERQRHALEYIVVRESINRSQYVEAFVVSERQAARDLAVLLERGLVRREGRTTATYYVPTIDGTRMAQEWHKTAQEVGAQEAHPDTDPKLKLDL